MFENHDSYISNHRHQITPRCSAVKQNLFVAHFALFHDPTLYIPPFPPLLEQLYTNIYGPLVGL